MFRPFRSGFLSCLAVAWLAVFASGCNKNLEQMADAPAPDEIPPTDPEKLALFYQINPEQADHLIENNRDLVVLDFRSPEAFALGHLPNAMNVPFPGDGLEAAIGSFDRKTKVFAYADLQQDRFPGVLQVRQMGFLDVYWLSWGYPSWIDSEKTAYDSNGAAVPRDIAEAQAAKEKAAAGFEPPS